MVMVKKKGRKTCTHSCLCLAVGCWSLVVVVMLRLFSCATRENQFWARVKMGSAPQQKQEQHRQSVMWS